MSSIEKDIRKYISEVGNNLICSGNIKKQILNDIENDILDYVENNDIAQTDKIYTHFGSPEELAKSFLSVADIKTVKRKIRTRNIILAIAAVALTAIAVFVVCTIIKVETDKIGFYVNGPIEQLTVLNDNESYFFRIEDNT